MNTKKIKSYLFKHGNTAMWAKEMWDNITWMKSYLYPAVKSNLLRYQTGQKLLVGGLVAGMYGKHKFAEYCDKIQNALERHNFRSDHANDPDLLIHMRALENKHAVQEKATELFHDLDRTILTPVGEWMDTTRLGHRLKYAWENPKKFLWDDFEGNFIKGAKYIADNTIKGPDEEDPGFIRKGLGWFMCLPSDEKKKLALGAGLGLGIIGLGTYKLYSSFKNNKKSKPVNQKPKSSKNNTEKEPTKWITIRGGKHIPIYDESIKISKRKSGRITK